MNKFFILSLITVFFMSFTFSVVAGATEETKTTKTQMKHNCGDCEKGKKHKCPMHKNGKKADGDCQECQLMKSTCEKDIATLCQDAKGEHGKMHSCLETNIQKLSQECKTAFEERKANCPHHKEKK